MVYYIEWYISKDKKWNIIGQKKKRNFTKWNLFLNKKFKIFYKIKKVFGKMKLLKV